MTFNYLQPSRTAFRTVIGPALTFLLILTTVALVTASAGRPAPAQGSTFVLAAAPVPSVTVTLSPSATVSGASVVVTVVVTLNGTPQSGATIRLSASAPGGPFSPNNLVTGSDGTTNSTFTAPTVPSMTNISISAQATVRGQPRETGTANLTVTATGAYLAVLTTLPQGGGGIHPNATVLVESTVTNNTGAPVSGATVTLGTTGGSLSSAAATTSSSGLVVFYLKAPYVPRTTTIALLTTATASGFASGSSETTFNDAPGTTPALFVTITPAQTPVKASELVVVTVEVRNSNASGTPVPGATVQLILSDGAFSPATLITNATGLANFIWTVPASIANGAQATLTASATAGGFAGGAATTNVPIGTTSTTSSSTTNTVWLWAAVAVVIAAIVIIGLYFAMRRRPPRSPVPSWSGWPPPRPGSGPSRGETPPSTPPAGPPSS